MKKKSPIIASGTGTKIVLIRIESICDDMILMIKSVHVDRLICCMSVFKAKSPNLESIAQVH